MSMNELEHDHPHLHVGDGDIGSSISPMDDRDEDYDSCLDIPRIAFEPGDNWNNSSDDEVCSLYHHPHHHLIYIDND